MTTWIDVKNLAIEEGLSPAIIAAEVMQIAFLDGLYGEKEGLEVVLHGGTAVRLLHSGYRYSEDLDFCISDKMDEKRLGRLVEKAYRHACDLITLHFGRQETELRKKEGRKRIATWWFNLLPPGERRKYRVKIEFGAYPIYLHRGLPLRIRNSFMPRQPVIISTDIKELLADKINALADRPYVKERDFFDVWYLLTVLNAPLDVDLVRRKLVDYNARDPRGTLQRRMDEMDAEKISESMNRFLPVRYRRMFLPSGYQEIIDVCHDVMDRVLKML